MSATANSYRVNEGCAEHIKRERGDIGSKSAGSRHMLSAISLQMAFNSMKEMTDKSQLSFQVSVCPGKV